MHDTIETHPEKKRAAIRTILKRKGRVDIGVPALGESTLITVGGEDFRAEYALRKGSGIRIEGFFERDSNLRSITLGEVDSAYLDELRYSIESSLQNRKKSV